MVFIPSPNILLPFLCTIIIISYSLCSFSCDFMAVCCCVRYKLQQHIAQNRCYFLLILKVGRKLIDMFFFPFNVIFVKARTFDIFCFSLFEFFFLQIFDLIFEFKSLYFILSSFLSIYYCK